MRRHNALRTCCLALVLAATTAGPAAAQVISATPKSIDFGTMKQHEMKEGTIVVRNDGAAMLKIDEVKADCGCTVPTLDRDTLAPGESTEIKVQFDSKLFEGRVYKSVQIMSNDPDNPVVDVMITADIHAPLTVDPGSHRLGFTRSLRGDTPSRRAVFTAHEGDGLELTIDRARKGLFDARIIDNLDGDPMKAALEVTIPADMAAGQHRDNIRVKTNIPETPYVDIEAKSWVTDVLQTSPEEISYRYRKNLKNMVRVSPFEKGISYKITGAEIDMPEIEVEVVETVPNQETQILLSGEAVSKDDPRAVAAGGRMSGTLKIFTDLKQLPVIEIPVTYMVRM